MRLGNPRRRLYLLAARWREPIGIEEHIPNRSHREARRNLGHGIPNQQETIHQRRHDLNRATLRPLLIIASGAELGRVSQVIGLVTAVAAAAISVFLLRLGRLSQCFKLVSRYLLDAFGACNSL